MPERVVVIGGGVAGMSAAHLLVRSGFDVTVYEYRAVPGGKARSMDAYDRQGIPAHVPAGPGPAPGEHGFRFFPGFYRFVRATMEDIGLPGGGRVAGNLRDASEILLARAGGRSDLVARVRHPDTPIEWLAVMRFAYRLMTRFGVPLADWGHFWGLVMKLESASERRRYRVFEMQTWWEFCEADHHSVEFGRFIADGLTRSLVAAGGREISARTAGYNMLRLYRDMATPGGHADSVLNGPTSDVWLDPWLRQLHAEGVDFRLSSRVDAVENAGGRVTGIRGTNVAWDGSHAAPQGQFHDQGADFYILAVPVEALHQGPNQPQQLSNRIDIAGLRQISPALAKLDTLRTSWMNGIQFYLNKDVNVVHGHAIFVDSGWAVTLISQAQFWRQNVSFPSFADGNVRGILSVDVSDWYRPDGAGRLASKCSAHEIAESVWAQLKEGLNNAGQPEVLSDANLVGWFLDPDIVVANPPGKTVNCEPLLINVAGSWFSRPKPKVAEADNLYLAADYVQTSTDLATMEAANEAARLAVAAIIADSSGVHPPPAPAPPEFEPEEDPYGDAPFIRARQLDEVRYQRDPDAPLLVPFHIEGEEAVPSEEFLAEVQGIDPSATREEVFGGLEQRIRLRDSREEES